MRPFASASASREGRVVGRHFGQLARRQVLAHRVGNDEVAVGQPLHQGAGAQAIGAVVGEVGLAQHEQAGDRAFQVVVDPQAAHRVMDGRIDPHRRLVRVFGRDLVVHVEQVAVLGADRLDAVAGNRIAEVEIDRVAGRADAVTRVAPFLGGPRGDVARHQVAEGRVAPLEEVIAIGVGNLVAAAAGRPFVWAPRRGRRSAGFRSSA